MSVVAAVDLGAESGRVVAATFTGSRIDLDVVRRFSNPTFERDGRSRWDLQSTWGEIEQGLRELGASTEVASVGVDAWGVDYGLLRNGELLESPVTYRDPSRKRGFTVATRVWDPAMLYSATGAATHEIYSLYALFDDSIERPELLERADRMLMIPDIFHRLLSGSDVSEYTAATSTGMFDLRGANWASDLLRTIGIPLGLLPTVVPAGTQLGGLRLDDLESGLRGTRVIMPASHDTSSAVLAVPDTDSSTLFISSGTWSLTGVVRAHALIDEDARARDLTNEGAYGGDALLLENVAGLWVLQECRRQWQREGVDIDYESIVDLARAVPSLRSFVDVAEEQFLSPGDMPSRIRAACRRDGMQVPETPGEIARVVIDSLALAYRSAVDNITAVTGEEITSISVVGGGVRNSLLQSATAAATGLPVRCWSAESSALGNVIAQLISLGELAGMAEAQELIEASVPARLYEPDGSAAWDDAVQQLQQLRRDRAGRPELQKVSE